MQVKVSKFHILIDKSDEQVASSLPIESNAIALILFECAFTERSIENSSHSQIITEQSSEPETSKL